MYEQVIASLREAYNRNAEERERGEVAAWKQEERQHFLELLQQEGKQSFLEIGAGTGKDSKFFQDHGLQVISTDLSPEMVRHCQDKGLAAYVMDFLHLDFPASSFDAIYSFNSLLHVPGKDLPLVFKIIHNLLKPGGLFYMGLYGGDEFEGIWPEDVYQRFFSYHTDAYIQQATTAIFDLVYFKPVPVDREGRFHFQSLILRRRQLA